ncbi:MAG: polysaccharide biosynthesis protein [Limnochordia bacterium]|nr:polysaccharide biosynthesis protein [Limnochordia bacterium]
MIFNKRKFVLMVLDVIMVNFSLLFSIILHYGQGAFGIIGELSVTHYVVVSALSLIVFGACRMYSGVWRYASTQELISMGIAVTIGTGATMLFSSVNTARTLAKSVFAINWFVTIVLLGGLRLAVRVYKEYTSRVVAEPDGQKKILIVGAGDAGALVAQEISNHKELGKKVIGFADDDPGKLGRYVRGSKVLGSIDQVPELVANYRIDEIIIAVPSASGSSIKRIMSYCDRTGTQIQIVPGIYEILNGKVDLGTLREVQLEDLLRREPIRIDQDHIRGHLAHKTVLITGGGGSIGSELARQVARFEPSSLVLFDISENNLYQIQHDLNDEFPHLTLVTVVGSIRDEKKLEAVFAQYRPSVVYHAAAHKHVPLMEEHPEEAIKNNVFGTYNVVQAAIRYRVKRFVMISTDKAINPTSVMGATKRIAEMIVQAANHLSNTEFVAVRFGNVLGSCGSVVPLFRQQIAKGGPVTVTHPEMTRYFMTIPEACQLVIQAGVLGHGGEVFVLDMGSPVKIMDLAQDLIHLSGLQVGRDIEIKIIGTRPGEKLYEEILTDEENTESTKHEKVFVAKLQDVDMNSLRAKLTVLDDIIRQSAPPEVIRKAIQELVPTYVPTYAERDQHVGTLPDVAAAVDV